MPSANSLPVMELLAVTLTARNLPAWEDVTEKTLFVAPEISSQSLAC
jgi:hypothetical protein